MQPTETRAEIARRRLAALVEEFHAQTGAETEPEPRAETPTAERHLDRAGFTLTQRHVRAAAVLAVAAGVVLAWWLFAARPQHEPVPDVPVAVAASSEPETDLIIDVVGHVKTPGIVVLPAGSRVADAIEAAGGITGDVERETLNFARELSDGEQILVGVEPATPPDSGGSAGGSNAGGSINLNTADQAALEELPGVGPVTAQAIIDHRAEHGRFTSVDALIDVPGIGAATLAKLRRLVGV